MPGLLNRPGLVPPKLYVPPVNPETYNKPIGTVPRPPLTGPKPTGPGYTAGQAGTFGTTTTPIPFPPAPAPARFAPEKVQRPGATTTPRPTTGVGAQAQPDFSFELPAGYDWASLLGNLGGGTIQGNLLTFPASGAPISRTANAMIAALQTGIQNTPEFEDLMRAGGMLPEQRADRLIDLINAGQRRTEFIAADPSQAGVYGQMPLDLFSPGGIFGGEPTDLQRDLFNQYGAELGYLNGTEWGQLQAFYEQTQVPEGAEPGTDPLIDPVSFTGMVGELVQNARFRNEQQAGLAAGEQTLRGSRAAIPVPQPSTELIARLEEQMQGLFIDDTDLQNMIEESDRLIRRTFGEERLREVAALSGTGFSSSDFSQQLAEQRRARSLEASLGARTELRGLQISQNRETSLRFNSLLAQIGNADQAAALTYAGMVNDLDKAIANIQMGNAFVPQGFGDMLAYVQSLKSDLETSEFWQSALNPDLNDWIQDIISGIVTAGTQIVAGQALG